MYKFMTYDITIIMHCTQNDYPEIDGRHRTSKRQRRENMVGVHMVLAEFIQFKHGLCISCGTVCFEGTMLEPCLLQPCFLVA